MDSSACVDFLRRLIRVPSLPGEEGHVARLVRDEMEVLGYHAVTIDAAGNVIGIIRGRGTAPPVMFNTHRCEDLYRICSKLSGASSCISD